MIAVIEGWLIAVIAIKALSLGLHEFHMWTDSMTVLNWINVGVEFFHAESVGQHPNPNKYFLPLTLG